MSNVEKGHGSSLAVELDPAGAQGTFTVIEGITSSVFFPTMMRTSTETTPHDKDIDQHVSGVLRRDAITITINYDKDEGTHSVTSGFFDALLSDEIRGYRARGPSGSSGSDEVIFSGFVESINPNMPAREGQRTIEVVLRPSDNMIVDGTEYGTV